jgi:hypothetical protein
LTQKSSGRRLPRPPAPLGLLPLQPQAAARRQHDHEERHQRGGRQAQRQPLPLALLLRLGAGLRLRQLRLAQAGLHRLPVGGQLRRQHGGVPRPICQPRRQASPGQADQFRVRATTVQPGERLGQVGTRRLVEDLHRLRAAVGRLSCEDFTQDGPQSEDVTALVEPIRLARRLFRRHVGRGPQNVTRPGMQPRARRATRSHHPARAFGEPLSRTGRGTAFGVQHLGESPVHDLDLAEGAHHDVGGLEVAVDHPLAVGVGHRLAHLLEHLHIPAHVGNQNGAHQTVIAGSVAAIAAALEQLPGRGLRVRPIPVSAPFHTPLLSAASAAMESHLGRLTFRGPALPVYSNTTGRQHAEEPEAIRRLLARHISEPVLFEQEVRRRPRLRGSRAGQGADRPGLAHPHG